MHRLTLLPILSVLALGGCAGSGTEVTLPDWTPGDISSDTGGGDTGDTSDTGTDLGGTLEVSVNLQPVITRFGTVADPTAACQIDTTAADYTVLDCQLEINELDLYFNGWSYDLRIPSGTCEYLGVEHYLYEAWHHGTGPTSVEVQFDQDGNWVADVANAQGGDPECEFDHRDPNNPEAPNCCYGEYTYTAIIVDGTGAEVSRETSPPQDWGGGAIGNCYAGAAYKSSANLIDPITQLPRYLIVDIDEDLDNVYSVSFTAPIAKPESSNVTLANYVDPTDGIPAGVVGPYARDHYAIECLDRAFEVSARFEMYVREWDEKAEYLADGDPNSGIQSSAGAAPPLEANGSGSPINDHWDWADFKLNGVDYVGSDD